MNIYQRIVEVQKVCTYVKKDAEVGYGKNAYKAVTHDTVMELVRQPMIDNGIMTIVSQQAKGEHYDGETKSGTAQIRFEAVYDITFVNIAKPDDRFTVSVEAHGEDFNDKAPGKAISYATKTAFLKTFQIATGENDESRLEGRKKKQDQGRPFLNTKDEEAQLRSCFDLKQLQKVFTGFSKEMQHETVKVKDEMKAKLTQGEEAA